MRLFNLNLRAFLRRRQFLFMVPGLQTPGRLIWNDIIVPTCYYFATTSSDVYCYYYNNITSFAKLHSNLNSHGLPCFPSGWIQNYFIFTAVLLLGFITRDNVEHADVRRLIFKRIVLKKLLLCLLRITAEKKIQRPAECLRLPQLSTARLLISLCLPVSSETWHWWKCLSCLFLG